MTKGQAEKLALYTAKLGYDVVVIYCQPRWTSTSQTSAMAIRCRRRKELWTWLFHHCEWPSTMRYFRSLDRADGRK